MSPRNPDDEKDDNKDLLQEIRERYQYASDEWREVRNEAAIDMRYVNLQPWDPEDARKRTKAGRPALVSDELHQHFNQVINGVRSNKRAIKFSPTGDGASEKTAAFYANKTREIEYRSHAQMAYTTAFQDCIHRGYGFIRLTTKFASDRSSDQELWIEPVVNPDMVLPDPDARRPDLSDQQYCFVYERWKQSEFKRKYPKAKVVDFSSFIGDPDYTQWVDDEEITLAEYWKINTKTRKLLMVELPGGQKPLYLFEDELKDKLPMLPAGVPITEQREVEWPSVCQYLTNGVEILQKTYWLGKYIPIISCFGLVLYVEGKRNILSMTRAARDPYMLYCYIESCIQEVIGGVPRASWIGYEGQFAGHEGDWQRSNHEPVVYLEAKGMTAEMGQQFLPLPQRQTWDPPIQNLEIVKESVRRQIQAAMMGAPLPTQAQRQNEKSGVALKKISDSAQQGSYHFNDHLDDLIRCAGVQIEDILPKLITGPQDVGVRLPNDKAEKVRVNDPQNPQSINIDTEHQVTVSIGPALDSERDAVKSIGESLMSSPFAPQVVDLVVKLMADGAGGATLDELVQRLTPPQFQKPGEDGQPTPQMVQQLQSQLQQVGQAAQQMKQALDTDQAKQAAQIKIKQMDIAFQREKLATESETKITVAELGAKVDRLTLYLEERDRLGVHQQQFADRTHEAIQNEQDRQHEAAMAQMGQQHALEQGVQGAALTPPPNGNGA